MYRKLYLATAIAAVFSMTAQADLISSRAEPGHYYASLNWGPNRLPSSGFVYGRNPGGTGPAYHFQDDVSGVTAGFGLGYVLQDAPRLSSWFGDHTRLLLAVSYSKGDWNETGTSPTGTKIPYIDSRTTPLQISTVPANQDSHSLRQVHRGVDLLLITDYTQAAWGTSISPFMGLSHYYRRERSELTSYDPIVKLTDMTFLETLTTKYSGFRFGAGLLQRLHPRWSFVAGASVSWLKAKTDLVAIQNLPTTPAPPGQSTQITDSGNRSTMRSTLWYGLHYDPGRIKIDLTIESNSWSYVPQTVNRILFTDPVTHLDSGRATDHSIKLQSTFPFSS